MMKAMCKFCKPIGDMQLLACNAGVESAVAAVNKMHAYQGWGGF
jgi:hypothetical protein